MTRSLSWVVGSGGLLGSNVDRALRGRGAVWRSPDPIQWGSASAPRQLAAAVARFAAAARPYPWQVVWCAGAGVTASTYQELAKETDAFDALLSALAAVMPPGSDGALFLASSAGGIYAGSANPPFTEHTRVRPISPYGESKLRMENAATEWAAVSRWPVLIGRIANLYGPGQDLSKSQGLISQVSRAYLTGKPVSVYVPLDTTRDFLYAADCGALVADSLARLHAETGGDGRMAHVKIIASGRGVTIQTVLDVFRTVLGRAPDVMRTTDRATQYQARDLRLRSVVWPEIDSRPLTSLADGIRATVADLSLRMASDRACQGRPQAQANPCRETSYPAD